MNKYSYLVKALMERAGLSYHQALGAVGSMMQESGKFLSTKAKNSTGSGALGIAQWLGYRKRKLFSFASKQNKNWSDFKTQTDFIIYELHHEERRALSKMKQATDYKQAVYNWTAYYERPKKNKKEYAIDKRQNYALSVHNYLSKTNPDLKTEIKTTTMGDPTSAKNENFQKGQSISDTEKKNVINNYVINMKKYQKIKDPDKRAEAINTYNKAMYNSGFFGYAENGESYGFLTEGLKKYSKNNEPIIANDTEIRKEVLRIFSKVMKDGVTPYNANTDFLSPYQLEKAKRFDGRLDVDIDDDLNSEIVKSVNKIAKLNPKDLVVRKAVVNITQGLKSKNQNVVADSFKKMENLFNAYSDTKVNLFSKKTVDGKTILIPGKDISYDNGFAFTAPIKPQDPGVVKLDLKTFNGFELPTYDPGPGEPAIAEADIDTTDLGNTELPINPTTYQLQAYSDYNNAAIIAQNNKWRKEEAERQEKNRLQLQADAKAQKEKDAYDERVHTAEKIISLGDIVDDSGKMKGDPSTFKSPIPWDKIAMGAAGIALGKSMIDQELPIRDERINNAYLAYINEQRRITNMGMNPSDEAAAKQSMAESYQMGVDNIVKNSSGNRALILANAGNLDRINADQLMKLSMEDAKIKQHASDNYGKAMEVINNFEQQRQIDNNERKYQQALQKQATGGVILGGAFKSMSDALSSYNSPDSAKNMMLIQRQVENMGWSPLVRDDGKGGIWGSKSKMDADDLKRKNDNENRSYLNQKLYSLPEAERREFLYKHGADLNQDAMYKELEDRFGTKDNQLNKVDDGSPKTLTQTILDANGKPVSQEQTTSNATVPMSVTKTIKPDGSLVNLTPYQTQTQSVNTDNKLINDPSALKPSSPFGLQNDNINQPIKFGTTNFGLPNGNNIQATTDKTGTPIALMNDNNSNLINDDEDENFFEGDVISKIRKKYQV